MRKMLIALAFAVTAVIAAERPAAAGINEKWCAVLRQDEEGVRWECQYATFEACRVHVVAGDRGFCDLNPAYVEPGRKTPQRREHRN